MELTLNQREARLIQQLVKDRDDAQRRMSDGINILAAAHDLPEDWERQGYQLTMQPDGSIAFAQPPMPPQAPQAPEELEPPPAPE